ncbi:PREDICTED: 2',5'-phosphodiesterase 12-like [Nicrophorus vespilloides]|uniref:2',5'-phosphodiesterase 12-like n=1 Tax=Nicrophorus vespilloides TaxID=110193 RepID=A0ABM1MH21_NICVS|nr:PREDICTED: 2',5'-phosphodiesterase 12-like [Nicrophorus vespilloides]
MDSGELKANLRFLPWQNQCTFMFPIYYKNNVFELDDQINISVLSYETINEFMGYISDKINKLIHTNMGKENGNHVVDLKVLFKNRSKLVSTCNTVKHLESLKHLTFSILGIDFPVLINAPLIQGMKLPEIIFHGHSVSAINFKFTFVDNDLSSFTWYKSKDKIEWEQVGRQFNYLVKKTDADHYLKLECLPINSQHTGEVFSVISQNVVCAIPQLPVCPFEDRQKHITGYTQNPNFRVVCYNTLSCRYTGTQFTYCDKQHLSVDYRKQLIMKELTGYKADIICLQEVDNKVFSFYFRDEFKKLNYAAIYNKKGNVIPEGLATIFNTKRFSFFGQGHIVFNMEVKKNPCLRNVLRIIKKDQDLEETFMKQATSLQFCKLKNQCLNEITIVANTHLYYHPDASNVRLIQTVLCLDYLKNICSKEIKHNPNYNVGLIFCGDFNSTPDSEVYKFLVNGTIQYENAGYATTLFHPFSFKSACGTPQYTNYTKEFKACLDYIFVETKMSVVDYVPFPSEDILKKDEGLPSAVFPSDHLPLIADVKY